MITNHNHPPSPGYSTESAACFKVNDEKAAVFAFFEKDVARDLHGKTPDDALKELGKLGYIKTESSSNKRFRRSSEYDSSDE